MEIRKQTACPRHGIRTLIRVAGMVIGLWTVSGPGTADAQTGACSGPEIRFSGDTSDVDIMEFEAQFRKAWRKACTWWGDTYTGPVTIEIDDSRGPSMALVPAWRGERGTMLFRLPTVRAGRNATTHEIVHVLAPNANRLLAEGLAVYAHERLGGVSAYPNFGKDLHEAARGIGSVGDIPALERIATPHRLENEQLDGKEAYKVAGSFVRFLFERYGEARFRQLYALTPLVPRSQDAGDPGRWQQVYGLSLEKLDAEWRAGTAR